MLKSAWLVDKNAPPTWRWMPVVGLLLLFGGLRVYDVLSFPAFVDEVIHIEWASDLYDQQPFTGAANGKLFGLWWMALLGLEGDSALWVARAATALFALVGAAAVFSITRHLASFAAGLVALSLYSVAPYSLFYDRMALADPYLAVWAALALWFAVRYLRQRRRSDAVLAGLALTGGILAKANGVTLAVIPGLVYGLLRTNRHWRTRLEGFVLSYGAFAASWFCIYFFLRWRGYGYFGTATSVVGTDETANVVSRTLDNARTMWDIHAHYFSWPLVMLGVALALYLVWRRPRVGLLLLGVTLIPLGGTLAFTTKMSARYFYFHVPLLLVTVAVAASTLDHDLRAYRGGVLRVILPGLALLWLAGFVVPFADHYVNDPAALDLPPLDRLEYVTSDAAGFAVPDLASYLVRQAAQETQPSVVVGLFANCAALGYYIDDARPVRVECFDLKLDMSHQADVIVRVEQLTAEPVVLWVIFEESPYISLRGITVPLASEATFARPDQLTQLEVWRAAPYSSMDGTNHD